MTTIRLATEEDANELCDLLFEAYVDFPIRPQREKTQKEIDHVLKNGKVVVAEKDGKLIGSIGLIKTTWWFTDEPYIKDTWCAVHPDHRKSLAFVKMIKLIKRIVKTSGWPLVMYLLTFDNIEKKERVFNRFFTPVGSMYSYGFITDN